MNKHHYSNY